MFAQPTRFLALLTVGAALGCSGSDTPAGSDPSGTGPATEAPFAQGTSLQFRDALAKSGISWRHQFIDQETGSTYKLNPYDHGAGVLVADVNRDGHDDVLFLNFIGENGLFLGQGDGRFQDATRAAGIGLPRAICVGGCFGDYDNDGDPDLYVTTYRLGNHLFRNRGDGTFEDVTEAAGVAYTGHSNSATFFDYDMDGDVDLYLTNIGKFTTETIDEQINYYLGEALEFDLKALDTVNPWQGEANILWSNNGDGTFTDVTEKAGVGMASWNGDMSVWDYDSDGDPDLYVANMFGTNNLYRNEGDGTFTDVAAEALGLTSWGAIGCRFFDADNDGLAEILAVDMHSDMWIDPYEEGALARVDGSAKYMTPAGPTFVGRRGNPLPSLDGLREAGSKVLFGNSFFHNQGNGKFVEKSIEAGLETFWPWGIAIGDFDADGFQDVFLPAGMSYPYGYWPSRLMRNRGDLTFEDVSKTAGIDPPPGGTVQDLVIRGIPFSRSSRTAAVLDMDHDGALDLIVANFNDAPYVFANASPARSWLAVDLVGNGKTTSRDATGSTVTVRSGGMTQIRSVESATGYLAQSSKTLHFGLGESGTVEKVTVRWLGGKEQDVTALARPGQRTTIRQPD